jgi:anti-sigma28 factor (negative regulator of flagellin synthesis)
VKINDAARLAQYMSYQKVNRQQGAQHSGAVSSGPDEVLISKTALDMARELNGAGGAERAEHVASVKQSLQNGTYHVEPDLVVRKMLAEYGDE